MERIDLENVDDAIKREKLFVKAATKLLSTLEFKRVEEGYEGELLRSQKEIEFCERHKERKVEKIFEEHSGVRARKAVKEVDLDSEDLGPEDFIAPMETSAETRKRNKKKYKDGVTRSLRRRQVKSRQKRHRR